MCHSSREEGFLTENPVGKHCLERSSAKENEFVSLLDKNRKNPINSERPPSNCDRQAPLFYFADICAGPGGFSEYMLWRKRFYNAKGFGFTLKGTDDVRLGWFTASSPHYFEPFYGKLGDGDVMKPENINSLEEFIMEGTNNVGVDLMMADGGYNVKGSEVIQEIISQRLYLCQMLASLCVVREGGNSLCKLFDVFTPFSAGLIYLMCVAYDQVAIHKPHNSRPANSERWLRTFFSLGARFRRHVLWPH
ncbi:unnamed protein product [Heligmosomoides polygyrus]|uniref:Cap-specific mRNA (nucleoside-2'-O-)-methyltransferase 1 n=1 Tax=Heligmosomoides polygyrus TaxID=6339 RepID=A0A183F456_HELPZ|nr:unnamed protein product [Heligmosomoides polygyrus]